MTKNKENKRKTKDRIIPQPNEKQKKFLLSECKYVAYGGARGGGKSWALRLKAMLLGVNFPQIKMLLLRRTFPQLRENHIRPLKILLKDTAVYTDSKKCFEFNNGAVLKLGYCDSESDVDQYQGQEYDVIFIDEATQFTEYQFSVLKGCLRGVNDFPKRMYLTCNPGGVGHGWVKRLFIDREYSKYENPADYDFIQALVTDNKPLMENNPDYVNQLKELPEDIRRGWLYGDWDVYEGQYFDEFKRDIHVCDAFEIPDEWNTYIAFDYGLDMLACLWIAVDFEGRAYVYKELCESGLIVSEAAKKIKEMSDREPYMIIAPPDMHSRQKDSGKSMRELFSENGIDVTFADNGRVDGWMCVKEYLKPVSDCDENITSRLKIFSNCKTLIKSLPQLMHDTKNPSDCSTVPHNITHAPDALRYFASAYTAASKQKHNCDWIGKFRKKQIVSSKEKRRRY